MLIDKVGSAYLFYSLNKIFVAGLKPNMLEIEGEPAVIDNLPTKWHLLPHVSACRERVRAARVRDEHVLIVTQAGAEAVEVARWRGGEVDWVSFR